MNMLEDSCLLGHIVTKKLGGAGYYVLFTSTRAATTQVGSAPA